ISLINFVPNFLCVWIAKQDGLYMLNEAGQLVFHHHWKLPECPPCNEGLALIKLGLW
ncbi:hypothetical protein Csa_018490, partial [Cucumis sativus]